MEPNLWAVPDKKPKGDKPEFSIVILRPFKPFVTYEEHFKKMTSSRDVLRHSIENTSGSQDQSAKRDLRLGHDRADLLKDLKHLANFCTEIPGHCLS